MDKHVIAYMHKRICLFNHSAPAKKPRTSEHFQGSYSRILFPWVYLIVFRNYAEKDYTQWISLNSEKVAELTYFHAHSSKLSSPV